MSLINKSVSSDNLLDLESRDLLLGMFVSEIDCPWSDTPFPMGGFHLKKADDLQALQKFCKRVVIDTNKGAEPRRKLSTDLTILSSARRAAPPAAAVKVKRDTYPLTHSIKQQIDKTYATYLQLQDTFQILARAVREGKTLELKLLEKPVAGIIDSIIANPQTAIWILITRATPESDTSYCVRAAIWATILARQIGLIRSEIDALFLGTLLSDIGMHLLPERLVNKRHKFRKKEFLAYRKHVEFGLELLAQYPELDDRVVRIVRCHHERHDGLGFPRKLKGDQIPALARYASLAFCFERLLRTNCESGKISPARAIARLYKQRVLKFPEQLVVEFIHVMGMYPVGTLVELSSGELALVLDQNDNERLFPRVAVVTDIRQVELDNPEIVDLARQQASDNARTITTSVQPQQHKLDLGKYTFSFFGKRIGMGSLGFRV